MVPDRSLHFDVSNNYSLKLSRTVKFCAPGGQNVNSNKSVTNYYYYYYYGVTLQNLSIDFRIFVVRDNRDGNLVHCFRVTFSRLLSCCHPLYLPQFEPGLWRAGRVCRQLAALQIRLSHSIKHALGLSTHHHTAASPGWGRLATLHPYFAFCFYLKL